MHEEYGEEGFDLHAGVYKKLLLHESDHNIISITTVFVHSMML